MDSQQRVGCLGGITGMVGAALGAGSVLGLRPDLGWVLGLLAGAAVGGLGTWLAAQRLLRDATACLAVLGNDESDPEPGAYGPDGARPVPVLGSEDFDAWIAYLHAVLDDLRRVQAE